MTVRPAIAVCYPRPVLGSSELAKRADVLIARARARGFDATTVTLPAAQSTRMPDPDESVRWSLVDLTDLGTGQRLDAAVCLHPSTLLLRHSNLVAWLPEWASGPWEGRAGVANGFVVVRSTNADRVIDAVVASIGLPVEAGLSQ